MALLADHPDVDRPPPRSAGDLGQWVLWGMLLLSFGLHAATVAVLPALEGMADRFRRREPVEVSVVVAEPEPPPEQEAAPEPEPEPEPEEIPAPERARPVARAPRADEPEPPPPSDEPPAPAQETPVDFTGVTLTNDSGSSGWSSAVGDGRDIEGPVGGPGQVTGRRREGSADGAPGGTGSGPALVSVGELSSRPSPPSNLGQLLQDVYPERARSQGVEGKARVRIRVGPDGAIRLLATLSENPSGMGFADACRKALRRGGRWSPPRDRNGRPVATLAPFTCTFTVRY